MNTYEDERLEGKRNDITGQLGTLMLNMLLLSLKKINRESVIFHEFEDARKISKISSNHNCTRYDISRINMDLHIRHDCF